MAARARIPWFPRRASRCRTCGSIPIGGSLSLSFVPTTPGNWVFHCHFAGHVGEVVSLHGSPDAHVVPSGDGDHAMPAHDTPGGHTMRGLVIGMHVTPAPGYKEPVVADRRTINLLIQKRPNGLVGGQTAYGFVVQTGAEVPARDSVEIPGPVLELKRGQPVRILVKNNLDEPSGVHWHGLEIESFPDGVRGLQRHRRQDHAADSAGRNHSRRSSRRRAAARSRITRICMRCGRSARGCTARSS